MELTPPNTTVAKKAAVAPVAKKVTAKAKPTTAKKAPPPPPTAAKTNGKATGLPPTPLLSVLVAKRGEPVTFLEVSPSPDSSVAPQIKSVVKKAVAKKSTTKAPSVMGITELIANNGVPTRTADRIAPVASSPSVQKTQVVVVPEEVPKTAVHYDSDKEQERQDEIEAKNQA